VTLAAAGGVNASAIRYYEREGLLPEPDRLGGRRRYAEDTLRRLAVIDIAKRAGFSLDEIRVLLEAGAPGHPEVQALAVRKLDEVDALLARAQAMRDWLVKASACDCSSFELCDLFDQRRSATAASSRSASASSL
jgi:MerR family transcriptional regulator, redox-sensitive transcriptional activator SoxR